MKPSNLWLKHIKQRIWLNKGNYVVSFTGHPGTGKSYAAIDLCKTFDPTFDISRVCYTIEQFFDLMLTEPKIGTAIMLDEAGVAGNSKKAMHSEQIAYGEILKMMRFKRNLFVITSPNFNDYLKDGRSLIDAWVNFENSDALNKLKKSHKKTFAYLRIVKHNPVKNAYYYTRFNASGEKVIDKVVFDFPEELAKEYEKSKYNNFMIKLRENKELIQRKKLKTMFAVK